MTLERGRISGVRCPDSRLTSKIMMLPALVGPSSTAYTNRLPEGVNGLAATRLVVTIASGSTKLWGKSGGRSWMLHGSRTSSTWTTGAS
jgi:hypothetical protein